MYSITIFYWKHLWVEQGNQQIQTKVIERPFDHIHTRVCSPSKIAFWTLQYKVALGPLRDYLPDME